MRDASPARASRAPHTPRWQTISATPRRGSAASPRAGRGWRAPRVLRRGRSGPPWWKGRERGVRRACRFDDDGARRLATLSHMFVDPRLNRMAAFLGSIGIEMRPGNVDVPTLFPGSLIDRGALVIDESKLVAPGDALHEAAHIALSPPERRNNDVAFLDDATGGEELTTI